MRIALFLIAFLFAGSAQAACYNAAQLEAEQGLRIHSELMVIALNCQHLQVNGQSLYRQYEQFTQANVGLIAGYEETMRGFFGSEGKANPEAELNTFRTALANRIANDAVRLQPNVFCRAYASRIIQASSMTRDQFRNWAQTVFPTYPLTRAICPGVPVKTQAK